MKANYRVVTQEHDSTPYDDGVLRSREGAWKQLRRSAANLVPGWNHPVWVRVYRKNVLVFSGDLRDLK